MSGADGIQPAPFLIALPQGLNVSGVTTWAVRLSSALAARGRAVGLIIHPTLSAPVEAAIDPRVRLFRVHNVPPIDRCAGDIAPYIPHYRAAVRALGGAGQPERGPCAPVVLAPNLHGDIYAIAAALSLADPESIRTLGWQHSDIEYDTRLLAHYEPILHSFVAVSDAIEERLRAALRVREDDIANIPYGVPIPPPSARSAHASPPAPLRLIYTGRLQHEQKRILALVHLSDALSARGIDHLLTIVGDGPARAELERAASDRRGRLRLLAAASPEAVGALLLEHDYFILPSRYEGLSISMLEAMGAGCIPILARTRSGAAQAVESGSNGILADADPDADERTTGAALADALQRALAKDPAALSASAQGTIVGRYSLDLHAERVGKLIDRAAASPARAWPATRPCAFSAPAAAAGSGSVPPEGARLLSQLLERLAGRIVLIHGVGQHTLQLASILAEAPCRIVAFADDNPEHQGRMLWNWPIIRPADALATSATDVVISSWMHQEAIHSRRDIYERQGLRTHRIYPSPAPPTTARADRRAPAHA